MPNDTDTSDEDTETIVNERIEYRDHYIRIGVSTPAVPVDDTAEGRAVVECWDGVPPGSMMPNLGDASRIQSWSTPIAPQDGEDQIAELIEQAKERIDTRVEQRAGLREAAASAIERTLDPDDTA